MLDEAILELGALSDRDRILDFFFEHAARQFDFAVLFVVRGDSAHGRNVHGIGAPPGLVARLAVPLTDPGVLSRAYAQRKAFVAPGPSEEADRMLFGHLGRALPAPLVVPLLVRDRVVAIFVGDSAVDGVLAGAERAGRPAMDLLREEMMLWSESTGQVLERLILRRKTTGSSAPPPPRISSVPPLRIPPAPPPVRFEAFGLVGAPPVGEGAPETRSPPPQPARWRLFALAAAAALVACTLVAWRFWRVDAGAATQISLAGPQLPGWPRVDPVAVVDAARRAAGLGERAELASLQAEVAGDGRVDFMGPAANADGIFLRLEFVNDAVQSEVTVDPSGVHPGHKLPRERCGDGFCRPSLVFPPRCSIGSIVDAARNVGLEKDTPSRVQYATGVGDRAGVGAEWIVSVDERGSVHLDGATCKPLPRERFRPPPLPVARIPGAPHEVDPLAVAPLARVQSGLDADAALLEIEARGVSARGVVDLDEPGSGITFTFAEPLGSKRRRWRIVSVRRDGMPIASEFGDRSALPVRLAGTVVPPPRCTFAQARESLTRGASTPGTAQITYGPDIASGQTGLWSLEMATMSSRRTEGDVDCEAWLRFRPRK